MGWWAGGLVGWWAGGLVGWLADGLVSWWAGGRCDFVLVTYDYVDSFIILISFT